MDCNLPGSSAHGVSQAGVLEWVAISFSRGSCWPGDLADPGIKASSPALAGRFFTTKPPEKPLIRTLFMYVCSSSVHSVSRVRLFVTPWAAAHQASLAIANSRACSNYCAQGPWCHPTISSSVIPFSSCLQSFPSIRVFSNESALHISWPKYWSFSFNISPSNEYSRLISFRIDQLDLLEVQGTLKSLLQHHSSKVQKGSAVFIVQLSHPYMTTGKTTALTRWTFVDKV